MVSGKQARKDHKGSSNKIPSLGSKRNHGVTKQASNSLKYRIKRMNAHDSLLMKSFIRGVVKYEVERKFQELLISREKIYEGGKSGARALELRFINNNKLPNTTFTKTNIISKDEALQVALFDVRSKSIVNEGPLSSIKIEICPIKGDFESCDDEDWTEAEFSDNILHERENKEPLLVGDRFVTLENGVASISKIMFTDNSGWVRGKKFSLGAKAMKNGENIKEGRSQAFRVKDIRGEAYKKHYPPFLNDDVWRLKLIAENGPFHDRLRSNGIHTVKDLLRLLIVNESSLREKFGQIQKKCWLAIVEHARSCVVDDYKLYSYEIIGQPILLLFNVIYELVGVTFDSREFYSPDDLTLTPNQKNLVEIVKQDAYKNIGNLRAVDEGILNSISLEACIKSTQEQDLQHLEISVANVNDGMQNVQINVVDPVADIREIPQNSCDVLHDYFDGAECSAFVDLLNFDMDMSNSEKPKAMWCKIRAVVKWGISVRRVAAARRNEHLFYYDY
ncbi:calmodulin-binding protein 60 B-like isoform X2 [Vicia villosa]|uniref:calmodulin-binding protein 60 B-like isoform X2 n=1 Tax=Vicia villosa TaxID=3911 RepID=UPI00273A7C31|nr:calmodulin-binding protein 60 B-like isoform X2 [Vicia villosa]